VLRRAGGDEPISSPRLLQPKSSGYRWLYPLALSVAFAYNAAGMLLTIAIFDTLRSLIAPGYRYWWLAYSVALLYFIVLGGASMAYYGMEVFSRLVVRLAEPADPRLEVRISVVIPAYNAEETVGRVLRALIEQDYPKELMEVVVVDDGSTDGTYAVACFYAERYPYIRVVRHRSNLGKASALVTGIRRARGDVIVLLDADTVPEKHSIRRLVAALMSDDGLGAVCGRVVPAGVRGFLCWMQRIEYLLGFCVGRFFHYHVRGANPVLSGAFAAFRAPVLKPLVLSLRGVPEDTVAEDFDLTVSVWKRGFRTGYVDTAVAYTIAPDKLGKLYRQRIRWYGGGLQVLIKHLRALSRKKHPSSILRRVVVVDILFAEYFLPVLQVAGYAMLAAMLILHKLGIDVLAVPVPVFLSAFVSALTAVIVLGAVNIVAAFSLVEGAGSALRIVPYALVYVSFYIPLLAVAKVDSIARVLKQVIIEWR